MQTPNEKFNLLNDLESSEQPIQLKENAMYYTRGGWVATVIWINGNTCYVIHNPKTAYETGPVLHDKSTGYAIYVTFAGNLIAPPPTFKGHPADLVKEVEGAQC